MKTIFLGKNSNRSKKYCIEMIFMLLTVWNSISIVIKKVYIRKGVTFLKLCSSSRGYNIHNDFYEMSFHAFINFVHLQCYMQILKFKWLCSLERKDKTIIQLLKAVPQCNLLKVIVKGKNEWQKVQNILFTFEFNSHIAW